MGQEPLDTYLGKITIFKKLFRVHGVRLSVVLTHSHFVS